MVTMADTGLLAAPAAARHGAGKVQTPPDSVYSSAAEDTDSDPDEHRVKDQPVCLARANSDSVVSAAMHHHHHNNNNSINNNNNNNNNNSTRNKRKNFQPRNISYTQEDAGQEDNGRRPGTAVTGGGNVTASAAVLDLSACAGSTLAKRPRVDDGSAPMDLTCAVSTPPQPQPPVLMASLPDKRRFSLATAGHPQPHEESELKEYAQNTVRELLEIYGLNTDVADAITNNVPMVNFSTGRILESLAARGVGLYPALGLPLLQAAQKPASTASPSPRSSPANSAPPSPTQKSSTSVIVSLPHPVHHRDVATTGAGTAAPTTSLGIQTLSPRSTAVTASPLPMPTPTYTNAQDNGLSKRSLSPLALTTGRPETQSQTPSSIASALSNVTMVLQGAATGGGTSSSATSGDYSRYVRRFSSCQECGSARCRDLNYREHFHCLDCNSRVFVKKEEMIRHFKWHKKRDESLQHGFMRYSPSDDCSDRYQGCSHNRKQTHYHCIQGTCDKVYISTSDVQMHANYHRKDSAIIQEGFQRLRATEECRTPYCAFYGQRTTHFHCRRDHCQFTFKNKADMEKHKTYHIKDEQLARDGFKKFMKPDPCGFSNCRFSQVCNHIHCVRDGCNYVLHSSGQLLSHKRKHERKDSEIAYRKFKLAQQAVLNMTGNPDQMNELSISPSSSLQFLHQQANSLASLSALAAQAGDAASYSNSSSDGGPMSPLPLTRVTSKAGQGFFTDNSSTAPDGSSPDDVEVWPRYLTRFKPNTCISGSTCVLYDADHFHCKEPNCEMPVRNQEAAETHARNHDNQERINESFYPGGPAYCQDTCTKEQHYHCVLEGCYEAVLPSERGEHIKSHDIPYGQYNSLDALFRRKRGRPPKNRVIEVWNDYAGGSTGDSPQAIFTSFKLPKPSQIGQPSEEPDVPTQTTLEQHCFEEYRYGCPDNLCKYTSEGVALHYHCRRPRCFFATDNEEQLQAHSTHFHDNVTIMEGFLFFDSSVDCRLETCVNNTVNKHFHCVRAGCGFSFTRYSQMAQHLLQHQTTAGVQITDKLETQIKEEILSPSRPQATPSPSDSATSQRSTTVVKASGTFYPMSGLSNAKSSSPNFSDPAALTDKPKTDPSLSIEPVVTIQVLPEWMSLDRHEKYGPEQPCSRAFCKLKRKEHYHCNACNQAFSEMDKLKPHIIKHTPGAMPTFMQKTENNNNNDDEDEPEDNVRQPPALTMVPITGDGGNPACLPQHSPYPPGFSAAMAAAMANQQFASLMTSQGLPFMPHAIQAMYSSAPTNLMFAPPGFGSHPHPVAMLTNGMLNRSGSDSTGNSDNRPMSPSRDMSPEMRKARVQNSMRILKDEPVPEGYLRFRFNEDCHYTHCGYREHQTHFHCMRQDCGYSFCDKTRFVQHTARHERLDTLMGGDFQQYRANVSCGRADCAYASAMSTGQNKASHFHCLKCEFVCTDTNKVVAHRRQHQKLDSIMAAGFEKFTPAQACSQPGGCVHSGKQTHYHCLSCQYAVLGLSQMTAHKYRHME
ncbi:zinc finger protein castor homolog 1-like isoform X2 [Adelges cooleyi]|uniref:zinc finger protein castor homolog 1-like isoform X2 n=1 Tax=Adelges cooleyi TaxID=133065 RepID=UPI002180914D|nr:zinc finger protein castor homolog 1-like isoform X2 [Adelges cooleyi]